jgi:hypothetical protein
MLKSHKLRDAFRRIDRDCDGFISVADFTHVLDGHGFNQQDIRSVLDKSMLDPERGISFPQFVERMTQPDNDNSVNTVTDDRTYKSGLTDHFGVNLSLKNDSETSDVVKGKRAAIAYGDTLDDISPHKQLTRAYKENNELTEAESRILPVQQKVLNQIYKTTKGTISEGKKILSIFRDCEPDEFGLCDKADFSRKLKDKFGLSNNEVTSLCSIATSRDEVSVHDLRRMLAPVDMNPQAVGGNGISKALQRGRKKIPESTNVVLQDCSGEKNVRRMNKIEKNQFRDCSRIQKLVEMWPLKVKNLFTQVEERGGELQVHTKTRISNVERGLADLGCPVAEGCLRQLFPEIETARDGGKDITFSQLNRGTSEYMKQFEKGVLDHKGIEDSKLVFKGTMLGCRGFGTDDQPSSKNHVSHPAFLHHIMEPADLKPTLLEDLHQKREKEHRREREVFESLNKIGASRHTLQAVSEHPQPAGYSHRSMESSRSMGRLHEVRWTDKTIHANAAKKRLNRRHFGNHYQEPSMAGLLSHRDD